MSKLRRWGVGVAALPLLVAAGALTGCTAVSFTVTTATDAPDVNPGDGICDIGDGSCSLRAAITEADVGPVDVTTIDIAPGINPTLSIPPTGSNDITSGDLNVTKTLFLHGHGATIDGARLDGVIYHTAGTLAVDNLTVTHGILGIGSLGSLDLTNVTVDDNQSHVIAGEGGAGIILNDRNGVSTFNNVNVTNNVGIAYPATGGAVGAGVVVHAGADGTALVWHGGTISGNHASCCGAAIYGGGTSQTSANAMLLDHLTITNNNFFALSIGSATITDSYIAEGTSVFFNLRGPVEVARSTIVPSGSYLVYGCCNQGTLKINQSTFMNYGGAVNFGRGNIVDHAGPCVPSGMTDEPPLYIDANYNLHFDPDCFPDQFGPLANNGGPTLTFNPTAASAAVDKIPIGTPGLCDDPTATDQRGVGVPQGPACDIGAVERRVSP